MSGPLPVSRLDLSRLRTLMAWDTGLCIPRDSAFLRWLWRIRNQRIRMCGDAPPAYLTQAIQ